MIHYRSLQAAVAAAALPAAAASSIWAASARALLVTPCLHQWQLKPQLCPSQHPAALQSASCQSLTQEGAARQQPDQQLHQSAQQLSAGDLCSQPLPHAAQERRTQLQQLSASSAAPHTPQVQQGQPPTVLPCTCCTEATTAGLELRDPWVQNSSKVGLLQSWVGAVPFGAAGSWPSRQPAGSIRYRASSWHSGTPYLHLSKHATSFHSSSRSWSSSCSSSQYPSFVLDYIHTQYPSNRCPAHAAATPGPTGAQQTTQPLSDAAAGQAGTSPCAESPAAAAVTAAAPKAVHDPSKGPRGRVAAVAVSGGVDSAVSALLLQRQGYQLFGVYMHNWDAADEAGAGTPTCSSAADLADAKALCKALGIPLYEADFVAEYWNQVFETFLQGLSQGLTPNPDLACNSHIKFGALLQFARQKGADLLATGHYARLGWAPAAGVSAAKQGSQSHHGELPSTPHHTEPSPAAAAAEWCPTLLMGSDPDKDQSYFLAGLRQDQLSTAVFPVGHLTKAAVRDIAAAAGLSQATKRSSAGICFIGRRSFGKFLEAYLPPKPGLYVDAVSGAALGPCSNMLAVTVGQKAPGLGGQKSRVYAVGKDLERGVVYVAAGHDHPALYSSSILLQGVSWVAGVPPPALGNRGGGGGEASGATGVDAGGAAAGCMVGAGGAVESAGGVSGVLQCQYQARYRQTAAECAVRLLGAAELEAFQISRFCHGVPGRHNSPKGHSASGSAGSAAAAAAGVSEGVGHDVHSGPFMVADLQAPLRGVAPGQMCVLYDGEVCLGSATILAFGPTLYEQQQQEQQQLGGEQALP